MMSYKLNQNENIIELVEHVSFNKTEGKFYLMSQGFGWMPNGQDSFKISEHYFKVNQQRISSDEKEKVQLQLTMHASKPITFQFTNPGGRNLQIADRDKIKNNLQTLLPKFKDIANIQLQPKMDWLKANPKLINLYRELVGNKYLPLEDFWKHVEETVSKQSIVDSLSSLKRGIPSFLLTTKHSVNRELNLSKQMIADIFTVYPSVRKLFEREVPTSKTEQQFWEKFYQSHYFILFKTYDNNDLFNPGLIHDRKQITKAYLKLKAENETEIISNADELGFIAAPDNGNQSSTNNPTVSNMQEVIRRVNRKSIFILKTMDSNKKRQIDNSVDLDFTVKKRKITDSAVELSSEETLSVSLGIFDRFDSVQMEIDKVTAYHNRKFYPSTNKINAQNDCYTNKKATFMSGLRDLQNDENTHPHQRIQDMSSESATDVLTEIGHLFSNTDLTKSGPSHLHHNKAQSEMVRELQLLYESSAELFIHFWKCFPICNSAQFEKLHRVHAAIKKFQSEKINGFIQENPQYYILTGSIDHKVTDHLNKKVDKITNAFDRYMDNYRKINKKYKF